MVREGLACIEEKLHVKHIFGQKVDPVKVDLRPFEPGLRLASLLTKEEEAKLDLTDAIAEFTRPTYRHHFGKTWEIFTFLTAGSIHYDVDGISWQIPYEKGTTVIIPPPVIRKIAPYTASPLLAHIIGRPKYDIRDEIRDDT